MPGELGRHRTKRRRRVRIVDMAKLRRTVFGTAVGNFMEWYDYGIYGFLATTLATVFFPAGSGAALVATFGILAVSFGVRPIGGFFFGSLADRVGRKKVLGITIAMMAVGTTLIGVLPSYAAIGSWAFVLLILARVIQGFSTGGEYVDAMVYINEHAPDRRRGFWASFLPVGTLTGYITGAGLVTLLNALLSDGSMQSWGWRIPFLLAPVIGVSGLFIRLRLEESPVYTAELDRAENEQRGPASSFRSTLTQIRCGVLNQWSPLLKVIGLVLAVNFATYMLTSYIPTYLKAIVDIGNTRSLIIILIVLALLVFAVPNSARLSDRLGRRPVMFAGSILMVLASYPAFWLMKLGTDAAVFGGVLLIGILLLCFTAVEPATLPAMFPTDVRALGVAVGYNISVTAFGGTTPLIVESLVKSFGIDMIPAYYLMVGGVVGAVSVYLTRESAGQPLPGALPAAENEAEAEQLRAEQ